MKSQWAGLTSVFILYLYIFFPRLEEIETRTQDYRAKRAELRKDILENQTEKEKTASSLESAREALNKVREARLEAEERWKRKYLLNQSERLEERNRVKDLLVEARALLLFIKSVISQVTYFS